MSNKNVNASSIVSIVVEVMQMLDFTDSAMQTLAQRTYKPYDIRQVTRTSHYLASLTVRGIQANDRIK